MFENPWIFNAIAATIIFLSIEGINALCHWDHLNPFAYLPYLQHTFFSRHTFKNSDIILPPRALLIVRWWRWTQFQRARRLPLHQRKELICSRLKAVNPGREIITNFSFWKYIFLNSPGELLLPKLPNHPPLRVNRMLWFLFIYPEAFASQDLYNNYIRFFCKSPVYPKYLAAFEYERWVLNRKNSTRLLNQKENFK